MEFVVELLEQTEDILYVKGIDVLIQITLS